MLSLMVMVVMVVVWPHVVVTDTNLWVGIQEPSGFDSSQGTVKNIPNIRSQTQCAMRASTTPSSYMFQYNDGGDCVLYDKKEDSQGQYKLPDNTVTPTNLYTRLHNAPGLPCRSPFVEFEDGCYSLQPAAVTWCEARKYCVDLGGDLAYGPSFETLSRFLVANDDHSDRGGISQGEIENIEKDQPRKGGTVGSRKYNQTLN
ncbi:hypothetical protein Pmani_004714 [Petrolisthes manimaculis]|uniref:Uncharacterized protein n=1 Tax=Petrolisthes manimaculis TaxID=1843537 RepID=A0AAE1P542_9EUCA|nr:hypothetical protein Pmani_026227 [Petrolisthes manimaculis]KAK4324652.1 hypothetical protein Pmani_004714 [Petrolisthes manimaculis]